MSQKIEYDIYMGQKIEYGNTTNEVQLSNIDGTPVENVGELKKILEPFTDECKINAIRVFYKPMNNGASLKIALVA